MTASLGEVGLWTSLHAIGEERAAEAAQLAESLGFGALWVGGSPRLASMRPLLEASERLTIATGIVNVWQYEPEELAAEHEALSTDFPDRLLVGIGVGHPEATAEYATPLAKMRSFLDGLDGAPHPLGAGERCLAALAPRMLELSAQRALGAHTYFVPVEHTRRARGLLGPNALIATELACVIDADAESAHAKAAAYGAFYLRLTNYVSNLRRFGFEDSDFADGGSQRLLDAVVPQGGVEGAAALARAHLDAGASHVCVQAVGANGVPREEWSALAAALIG